jgi:outer membrane protein assembly factor BamE (lipoprotein component of BamABCDE complex)
MAVRSRSLRQALVFACAAGLGCVLSQTTNGTKLQSDDIEQIVVGESTREDVARIMGAPDEIIYSNLKLDPLFERAFVYQRNKIKTTYFTLVLFSGMRVDSNKDKVIVFFDDDGVVEDVAERLDMDKPRFGSPWGSSNGASPDGDGSH